jgi:hydroxypyruvate reductase
VVTRYGYAVPCKRIEIVEAAHPVPDAAGLAAAGRIRDLAQGLTADDLVVCLVSGGGSALLTLPLEGLTLDDKQEVNRALLKSGATISEMNCVRRHLSAIKGGRLGAACHPARIVTLLMSDVPGDNAIDIASGPTVADPTTCTDALDVLRRYGIDVPAAVLRVLESGAGETIKPGDARLDRAAVRMIATPQLALEAAARVARSAGYAAAILGGSIEGEARAVGKVLAGIALQVAQHGQPIAPPCVLLSGARRPSPSAATAAEAAMSSSCCRWRSRSTATPRSARLPVTPTGSTARRKSLVRSSRLTRYAAPGPRACARVTASPATTGTDSSRR